jgi:hypothetical protein
MLKTVLFTLLFTLGAGVANGQVLLGILFGDKLASEKFHIGLTAGANVSTISGVDDNKSKVGLVLGLLGEWKLGKRLYLQPELLPFYYAGAKNMPPGGLDDIPELEPEVRDKSRQTNLKYFEIPILFKYALGNGQWHLGAGPQIGFLLSAQDVYNGVISNEITIKADRKDILNSTDAGVTFVLEYKVGQNPFAMGVTARYYLGLTDILKDNAGDALYNRVFTLGITMAMGGVDDFQE